MKLGRAHARPRWVDHQRVVGRRSRRVGEHRQAALRGAVRAAVDLAPWNIRVNAICPGVIDTQMPRNFISDLPDRDEIWRGFEQGHLTGRLGRADEIVGLAVYLASDESTFMTGAVIPIDGGWSVQ